MKIGYIYMVTNLKKGHERYGWRYIGQRTIDKKIIIGKDKYMGSSALLKQDINDLGLTCFSKKIIESNIKGFGLLSNREKHWIIFYNLLNGCNYNISAGCSRRNWNAKEILTSDTFTLRTTSGFLSDVRILKKHYGLSSYSGVVRYAVREKVLSLNQIKTDKK